MFKSIITWSEMGKQTAQAKEVYIELTTFKNSYEKFLWHLALCNST